MEDSSKNAQESVQKLELSNQPKKLGVYSQQYGDVMLINGDYIYIYIGKIIGSITNLI